MLAKVRGWQCQWPVAVWSLKLCLRKDMEQILESHKPGEPHTTHDGSPKLLTLDGEQSPFLPPESYSPCKWRHFYWASSRDKQSSGEVAPTQYEHTGVSHSSCDGVSLPI